MEDLWIFQNAYIHGSLKTQRLVKWPFCEMLGARSLGFQSVGYWHIQNGAPWNAMQV